MTKENEALFGLELHHKKDLSETQIVNLMQISRDHVSLLTIYYFNAKDTSYT
jgi:hypothetical protein